MFFLYCYVIFTVICFLSLLIVQCILLSSSHDFWSHQDLRRRRFFLKCVLCERYTNYSKNRLSLPTSRKKNIGSFSWSFDYLTGSLKYDWLLFRKDQYQ